MTQTNFTGAEYLMIDAANNFGLDKEVFEKRIDWVRENLDSLESYISQADDPMLFSKSVIAIRQAQAGNPIGHLVELDATTSGLQIMSAMTGCKQGALWTNLVRKDVRMDAYTEAYKAIKNYVKGKAKAVSRKQAKEAIMTGFYGSVAKPREIFGEDTPELDAFYKMCEEDLEGCWQLKEYLVSLGSVPATEHSWTLPDEFLAYVPTSEKVSFQCEIDELDHHKFTHQHMEIGNEITTISLAANVVHSVDGYMVREVSRRCNYDRSLVLKHVDLIKAVLSTRDLHNYDHDVSKMVSVSYLDKFSSIEEYGNLDTNTLMRVLAKYQRMLSMNPTEVICIHDAYKTHANGCNSIRYWYKEILAEIAESNLLSDIISEIMAEDLEYVPLPGGYSKKKMAKLIREEAEYPIC
jgi:hypothetical protein